MNAKTIPTKPRSRGEVASYFLIFAFLFVAILGVVGDIQYWDGYMAGRKYQEQQDNELFDRLVADCPPTSDLP